jgi:signal transduction histidine kinase
MRRPLRFQIMGPLLLVSLASLAAVGAFEARVAANRTRDRIEGQLRGVVAVLATSNFPLTAPVLQTMRDLSSAEFALADATSAVVATSLAQPPQRLSANGVVARVADVKLGPSLMLGGRDYFHTALALPHRAGERRTLHVLFPRDEYRRAWREALMPPLLVGIVAIAAVAATAQILAARISRATTRLGHEVQRLARGDFSPIEPPDTDDEIRDLALAVNRTAQMLADYEQQVRRTEQMRTVAQLGASLAHELRNSATGCRMAVDLHVEACPIGEDDDSLAVAKRQLRLMEKQLQRFLQIGKQPTEIVRREVDLAQLIEDLLPLVRPAANHARVTLEWEPSSDVSAVMGDRDGLGQIALNLILNAIEAVQQLPLDGALPRRVAVELLRTDNDQAAIVVSDTGPGPAEAAAPAIFEPFVSSKAEGAGLGLAVARQVVEAHGGRIAWTRTNGVTQFRVTLPALAQEAPCV